MSRSDDFDAFYRESRTRLLHQTYAYTGDLGVARRALADAYVAAAHHWRKLVDADDRDAWVRERAFQAATRPQNRSRASWEDRALHAGEGNRPVLRGLGKLPDTERRLVIVRHLAGMDVANAARETGLTAAQAADALLSSARTIAQQGVETQETGLADALEALRHELGDEPVDRVGRLRREGNRRRRSHLLLAGICSVALAIGAGALTAANPEARATPEPPEITTPEPDPRLTPTPIRFSADQLTPLFRVRQLDRTATWRITESPTDFGATQPFHDCLTTVPSDPRAEHAWTREHRTKRQNDPTTAIEALEVSSSRVAAARGYRRLVQGLASCDRGAHYLAQFANVRHVGADASLLTLRHAEGRRIVEEQIGVATTGTAVITWVVEAPSSHPVSTDKVVDLLGYSVNDVCGIAHGACATAPYHVRAATPPAPRAAKGFLTAADLPLVAGVPDPWVATGARRARVNPAATQCDRANFAVAGARTPRARSFVMPTAERLSTIFGITETIGGFGSPQAARRFVDDVAGSVSDCGDRQLTLNVRGSSAVHVPGGSARLWDIEVGASEEQSVTFRMALVRVGNAVGQVTFTPAGPFDLSRGELEALTRRAGARLTQL